MSFVEGFYPPCGTLSGTEELFSTNFWLTKFVLRHHSVDQINKDHRKPHRLSPQKSATDSQSDSSTTDMRFWLSALISPIKRTSSEMSPMHTRDSSVEVTGKLDGDGCHVPKGLREDLKPV